MHYCRFCGIELSRPMPITTSVCEKCAFDMDVNKAITNTRKRPYYYDSDYGASSSSSGRPTKLAGLSSVSFEAYRQWKDKERSSRFKKTVSTKIERNPEVTIQIGHFKLRDGVLKNVRGSSLPLKVNPSIEMEELLRKGAEKMIKFNKDLICFPPEAFMLLYPDKSEVHFLPGSEDEIFSLQRYKEELGKSYQRISLYVCLKTDYNKSVFQDILSDNESDFECKEELDTNLSATNRPARNHLARNCSAINQSATSNSVENLSASSQPATSHLSRNQPATSQPATSHLSTNQPVTSQPATSHPSRNQPATCQSATAQSDTITSQSATDQPAISQPVLSQSEDDAIVPSPVQLSVKEMALHRSNVMKDMIDEFKEDGILNCTVNIMFLNDRGEAEEGRGSGVTREALSIFWREFFTSLAVGAAEKVPSIRHDYQKKEWQSVANVLVFGFLAEKFFPLQLSKAFIASCLFGEEMISKEMLIDSFYDYISRDEYETLKNCVSGECDPSTDDDIFEVLSSYKCYRVVTKESITKIIEEMAHQELIQRPRYISNAWSPVLSKLKMYKEFESVDSLVQLYLEKKPSPKKVSKILSAAPTSERQNECFDHLKRFVKSLDDNTLGVFLQFVTGSNYLTVDSIKVDFCKLEGAARRPLAHTCGCVLIIPETYQGYNELSEEFSSVLRHSASWEFGIV